MMKPKILLYLAFVLFVINNAYAIPIWTIGEQRQNASILGLPNYYQKYYQENKINSPKKDTFSSHITVNLNAGDHYTGLPDYFGNQVFNMMNRPTGGILTLLTINFSLPNDYNGITLKYGRYGSEYDIFYGELFPGRFNYWLVPGTHENEFQEVTKDFGFTPKGEYQINLQYLGGRDNNGHYFDYIELHGSPENNFLPNSSNTVKSSHPVSEPSTLILLSIGFLSILGSARTYIKIR